MTDNEFMIWAAAVKTYYPRDNVLPNTQAMELWYRQLKDIPYPVAEAVLSKWVATNKWSPTIADIRELASETMNGAPDEWGEAWEKVIKAVQRFGVYQKNEALASLDDLTRRCAMRVGFVQICMSENVSIERASFRDIYNRELERMKRDTQVPEAVKQKIEQMHLQMIEE